MVEAGDGSLAPAAPEGEVGWSHGDWTIATGGCFEQGRGIDFDKDRFEIMARDDFGNLLAEAKGWEAAVASVVCQQTDEISGPGP